MDELQETLHKLSREMRHLAQTASAISPDDPDPTRVRIALVEAKRVRRTSNLAVQQLAALRDQL